MLLQGWLADGLSYSCMLGDPQKPCITCPLYIDSVSDPLVINYNKPKGTI